jgi:PKD repeat protein
MLIVTLVILVMVAPVTAELFISSPGSPAQDEPMGIEHVQEATAACEDFGGLFSVYQGKEYTDAFSSVAYLGQGIVVAGKRSWNDFPPNIAIYRSTDYGLTWNTVPNPSGITGRHVYFFGQHNSRVFAGTGDEGNVCLMRSDDYGATWSVVLTTADLKTFAETSDDSKVKAVFTPVYMGENRWLVNLRNDQTAVYLLESLDDGDTWHAFYPTGVDTSARKMILTSDGTLLYAGFAQDHGMYVSHDSGYTFSKTSDFHTFAGMADLGNGAYLAGTYNSTYESGTQPPIAISIYKSSDYGQTWDLKTTVNLPTTLGYFRTIIKVSEDLVIAYASCSEIIWSDRCAKAYVSRDGGETWNDLGLAFIGPYGNMNAIYDTVLVKPGTFIATAQPDSNILRSINLPPVANAGPDQTTTEGAIISFSGSITDAGSCDTLTYSWDFGDSSPAITDTLTPTHAYGDNGIYTVTLTVNDDDGEMVTDTLLVTVDNVAPVVTKGVMDQQNPQFILPGVHTLTFHGTFSDPGWPDTHTALWAFGDGQTDVGTLTEENIAPDATGTVTATHAYSAPGNYLVTVTVTDDDGGKTTSAAWTVHVADVVEAKHDLANYIQNLPANTFKGKAVQQKAAFANMFNALDTMIADKYWNGFITSLQSNIRSKADGLVDGKSSDDWIKDKTAQQHICMKVDDIVAYVKTFM